MPQLYHLVVDKVYQGLFLPGSTWYYYYSTTIILNNVIFLCCLYCPLSLHCPLLSSISHSVVLFTSFFLSSLFLSSVPIIIVSCVIPSSSLQKPSKKLRCFSSLPHPPLLQILGSKSDFHFIHAGVPHARSKRSLPHTRQLRAHPQVSCTRLLVMQ